MRNKRSVFLLATAMMLVNAGFIVAAKAQSTPLVEEEVELPAPHTGSSTFESEKAPRSIFQIFKGFRLEAGIYFVYTNRLNVRSTPEVKDDNIVGALGLNDQVKILSEVPGTVFVKVEIIKSNESLAPYPEYFVAKDYLGERPNNEPTQTSRGRYFMIQNVATEILRVYEKQCDDGNCGHKMILETEIVVGEQSRDRSTMTVLGSFNITKWYKFYQDGGGVYPSWYDPSYPQVPSPGSGVLSWTGKSALPYSGAKVRGAFGWYTAHVGPDSHSQWTHGTIGWGSDKDDYIKATRGFWANLFADPRSHGCTRTDNESIAYIRHLLDVGTPVVKVYAVEAVHDAALSQYPERTNKWNYILTRNGVRVDGERPDREEVLRRGTPRPQWLEEGDYSVDVHPDVENFRSGSSGAKSGKNGNVYGLDKSEMRGVFLIDEGRLVDYAHPASLGTGGYGRNSFPGFVVAKDNPSYTIPKSDSGSDRDSGRGSAPDWSDDDSFIDGVN